MALSVRAGLPRRVRTAVRPRVGIIPSPPDVHVDWDLPIQLRDGVVLRANVFRPQRAGTFPVIVSAHPYNRDAIPARGRSGRTVNLRYRLFPQPEPITISPWTSWEAPDPAFWVPRGYVVVNADLRGGGTAALRKLRAGRECTFEGSFGFAGDADVADESAPGPSGVAPNGVYPAGEPAPFVEHLDVAWQARGHGSTVVLVDVRGDPVVTSWVRDRVSGLGEGKGGFPSFADARRGPALVGRGERPRMWQGRRGRFGRRPGTATRSSPVALLGGKTDGAAPG